MGDRCSATVTIWPEFLNERQRRQLEAEGKVTLVTDHGEDEYVMEDGELRCEFEELNYGGDYLAEAYVKAGIPFLIWHGAGGSYPEGKCAYCGDGEPVHVTCSEGDPVVRTSWRNGKVVVDRAWKAYLRRFHMTLEAIRRKRRNIRRKTR